MSEELLKERFRRCADVRYRIVDGEAVILRQAAAENIVLNEVGSSILGWLDAGCTVTQVTERLVQEYDVTPEQLAADLPQFLQELEGAGVVEQVASGDEPRDGSRRSGQDRGQGGNQDGPKA